MAISERWRDSLKNNDFPGYSAQKIDKIQGSIKNGKKRQKTRKNPRNRDTVYIYMGKSHFSGIQTSAPDDGRSFLARVHRLRSVLG